MAPMAISGGQARRRSYRRDGWCSVPPTHVSQLLKQPGLTPQLPTPQAAQRDSAAIEA